MTSDRLLGILTILLRQGRATAPELAARFEVSRRTINRDIDRLCQAGIPVESRAGYGGGFSIREGYRLPENLLTAEEMEAIFAGVQGLDSVAQAAHAPSLRDKLAPPEEDWISIDLGACRDEALARRFAQIRAAIRERRVLEIRYLYANGDSVRRVEPHRLVYRWGGWYLAAFCRLRGDWRLFRLGRIRALEGTQERFARRPVPEAMLLPNPNAPLYPLAGRLNPQCRHYALEEGAQVEAGPDGWLRVRLDFANPEARLRWALRFGDDLEVTEPESLRQEIARRAETLLRRTKGT